MACVLCSRNHHRARHDMYHHHLHRNWQPNNSIMLIRIAAIFGSNPRAWCSPCDHHGLESFLRPCNHHGLESFLREESMALALAPGVGRMDRRDGRKWRWRLQQAELERVGGQHATKTWGTSFVARTCARATCARTCHLLTGKIGKREAGEPKSHPLPKV